MALPRAGVDLVAQGLSDFLGDMRKAGRAVEDFADGIGKSARGVGAFGEMMTGSLRRFGEIGTDALMDAGRATADFVRDGISAAGDVEQTLNVLRVTSGATAEQMQAISKRAIELGGDLTLPATSAADASTAMLELSKAGLTADEAMQAAKGTLQLAAAAETDAGTAAQITAGALNAFALEASQAGRIADLLAGGANASSASMTDLAQGLQQGGFAFHQTGQSVEDLVTAVSALTNVGLTGSDAGTALKNAMMRLMNPTDKAAGLMKDLGFAAYDANGNMKPFTQIIAELNTALAPLNQEQRDAALGTIFLSDGMKAMTPLLALGTDGFIALRDQVAKTGSAQEVAGAQMQGWNGMVEAFNSQMETLGIVIGQRLLPFITPLLQQLGEAINKLTSGDFTGFFQGITDIVSQMVERIAYELRRLAEGTSPMTPFLDAMVAAFAPLGDLLMEKLNEALQALTVWIKDQAPVLMRQLGAWAEEFRAWIEPAIPPLMEELSGLVDVIGAELDKHMPAITAKLVEWGKAAAVAFGQAILDGIMFLGVALGMWILEQEPHINKALNLWASQFVGWVNNGIADMLTGLGGMWNVLMGWFGETAGRIGHEALKMGEALIQGFGNAIQQGVGWVRDQAWNMANAAREAAMHALGIGSPSKVFEQIGAWTAEGMQMGVQGGTPAVQTAMAQMASPVAYPGGGGGTTTNVTNNRTVSMPIYTNQTPAAIQQSWAIVQAVASGDI